MAIDIYEGYQPPATAKSELVSQSPEVKLEVGARAVVFSNNLPNLEGWRDDLGRPSVSGWPNDEAARQALLAYEVRSRAEAAKNWVTGDIDG